MGGEVEIVITKSDGEPTPLNFFSPTFFLFILFGDTKVLFLSNPQMTHLVLVLAFLLIGLTRGKVEEENKASLKDAIIFECLDDIRLSLSTFKIVSIMSMKEGEQNLQHLIKYAEALAHDVIYA